MSRRRRAAVLVASVVSLGAGTTAVAVALHRPHVEQVAADIVYQHATVDWRLCETDEGPFRQARVLVRGMATGDSRLAGKATARLHYLWNDESGDGYQQGVLEFRDAATGHLKARARFTDASVAEIAQGTMVGRITGEHGRVLIANWRTTWHDNGAVTAEIGDVAADERLPAVLVGGHCTGPFTRLEEDFPPPAEGSRTKSESADKRAGWLPE